MLGSLGYNTENLTANHSDETGWERRHVRRTLKNPAIGVGTFTLRHRRLNCPTLPTPLFLVAIKIGRPYYPCVPSYFSSFHVHPLNIAETLQLGRKTQSINLNTHLSEN